MHDAEQIVLGAMLRSDMMAWEIRPKLRAEMFVDGFHRSVYAVIVGLMDAGKRASAALVAGRLGNETEDGAPVAPRLYVMIGLAEDAPWRDFLDEIVQAWRVRAFRGALSAAGDELGKSGIDGAAAVLQDAMAELVEADTGGAKPLQVLVHDVIRRANHAVQSGTVGGFQTGVRPVDDIVGLMMPGELIVIGGPPGAGKTVMGAQVLGYIGRMGPTLFVEAEMPDRQIAARYLSAATSISVRTVWAGDLDFDQRGELLDAEEALKGVQMQVWGDPDVTIEQIRQKCASMKRTGGLLAVVVDHLSLIGVSKAKKVDKWERMEHVSRELKRIAVSQDCVVICLSQVTKGSQAGDRGVPRLTDLDGGGALERQADTAMVLFDRAAWILEHKLNGIRPKRDTDDRTKAMDEYFESLGKVELHVVKHRSGQKGDKATLRLNGKASRFEEI